MNSRETILRRIRRNRPLVSEEMIKTTIEVDVNTFDTFVNSIAKVGGEWFLKDSIGKVDKWLERRFGKEINIYSEAEDFISNHPPDHFSNEALDKIQVAVLNGEFGVAENGAIWIREAKHRAIPFITQHLILTLRITSIVPSMHEAYNKLGETDLPPFGVFISGPSKTADIEQSLVYGAHGPKTLAVILFSNV